MMRRLASLIAVLALAACASTGLPSAGETRDAVQARWGAPRGLYDLPDGGLRLLYINHPTATETYHFDFDAGGRLLRAEQVRTLARFETAGREHWRMSEVQRTFGVPTGRDKVEKVETDRWIYRFLDNRYPRLAILYFDGEGRVQRMEIVADPELDDDRYR